MTDLTIMQLADDVAIAEFKKLPESVVCIDGKEAVRYTPERTCQRVNKPDQFFADDFGYSVDAYRCSVCNFRLDRITNYCPDCGARVEGSEA